jgi:hypothetical protein
VNALRVWCPRIGQDRRARRESNPQPSASKVRTIYRQAYLMVVNCWKINELCMAIYRAPLLGMRWGGGTQKSEPFPRPVLLKNAATADTAARKFHDS